MGSMHHPIATNSRDAQRYFDQGLTLIYGFNHAEAIRSFEKALALDRTAVMPLWGSAFALCQNINIGIHEEARKKALAARRRRRRWSGARPRTRRAKVEGWPGATRRSRPTGNAGRASPGDGRAEQAVSDDLDVLPRSTPRRCRPAPRRLYDQEGKPAPGTEEIVPIWNRSSSASPTVGANHYYIHAMEASRQPERRSPRSGWNAGPRRRHLRTCRHICAHRRLFLRFPGNADAAKSDDAYVRATGASGDVPLRTAATICTSRLSAAMEGRC
jgi:hypothetical protein